MHNKVICILDKNDNIMFWDTFQFNVCTIGDLTFGGRPIECRYSYSSMMKEKVEFNYLDDISSSRPEFVIIPMHVTFKGEDAILSVIDRKDIKFMIN